MKDALGHGSDAGGSAVPFNRMNRFVNLAGEGAATRNKWIGSGHPIADLAAAHELGQNHPKSAPVNVHPAFGRRQ